MLRNVIFDWSGTLVDDLPCVWKATNSVFIQAGVAELTLEQFRAEFCLPFKSFYDRYTPHISVEQLESWFHGHFMQVQDAVVELPHARDFLLFCRQRRLRTFLLSTVHEDHFAVQTARNGFQQFLDRPYLGVWDKRVKIHDLLAENDLRPEETLFVGDMQHDIETAKHGGIFSCAVLTGYNSLAQLRASEPDLIVEHLGELRQILERDSLEITPRAAAHQTRADDRPVVTVGALIFDEHENVLMIRTHKWSNLWGIPGGKIKFGEASIEALRREIKEETNLDINNVKLALVQDCIQSREFYRDAHFVLLNYTCQSVGLGPVRLNNEAVEFRWVSRATALTLDLNQPTRKLLESVQDH